MEYFLLLTFVWTFELSANDKSDYSYENVCCSSVMYTELIFCWKHPTYSGWGLLDCDAVPQH
jgi:hypothetical protein